MRSDAKRPTAGSKQGRAKGLGHIFRGSLAARGASANANGSGAPSHAGRLSLCVLVAAALALLALAPLSQAKSVVNGFGEFGPLGGEFNFFPKGVAVNSSGNGAPAGTVYVVDSPPRIHRFSPGGAFERAWGRDVIAPSVNEQQRVFVDAGSGTFRLSFGGFTTAAIAHDATPGEIDDALDALPSIGSDANVDVANSSNVTGSDDPSFTVTFQGALGATDHPQLTTDLSLLPGTLNVITLADGTATTADTGTDFEVCTVADHCKSAAGSTTTENGGQLNSPQGIAVNQSNGHVYVTEQGNRRVSEFDPDGEFVRAWGWDVVMTGGTGDVSENAFEICTVASECKQAASNGDDGGRFSSQIGYPATDPSGNVWIPDAANERLQKFDSEGNFIAAYGWDVDAEGGSGELEECTSTALNACKAATNGSDLGKFSANSPQQIALDSEGNVYALDAGSNDRVQRFDPAFTEATEFGATALEGFTTEAPVALTTTEGGTRLVFAVTRDVSAPTESQFVELDPTDGSLIDTSLAGLDVQTIAGLAEDGAAGTLYATLGSPNVGDDVTLNRILALHSDPLPSPVASVNEIAAKTEATATLTGAVDPKGGHVRCTFQYSVDGSSWTDAPERGCKSLSPNGGAQAVSQPIGGLDPNTHYLVRLQVSRPLVADSTETSAVKSFDTIAPPPVITDVGAVRVTDTSARLVGTVDPRNSATGYVFEYGTSPALGSSTSPLNIGSGSTPITVSRVVGGLKADTDYYFRLVATNLVGTTASASKTFHTRTDPLPLPSNRAYEQVSPPDKNQGDAALGFAGARAAVSRDGESVGFCSTTPLFGEPSAQQTLICASYISRRGPGGWTTASPFPRHCIFDVISGAQGAAMHSHLSVELDGVVAETPESAGCPGSPLDPAAPLVQGGVTNNLYRFDLSTDPLGTDLLTPNDDPSKDYNGTFAGASDDLSHVVYLSYGNQTDPPDSPAPGFFRKLYEWDEGALRLVSVDTEGNPLTTGTTPASTWYFGTYVVPASIVSDDGERIFFQKHTAPRTVDNLGQCLEPGCGLYMREGGTTTFHVSDSECSEACGGESPTAFLWATPSGDKAFFLSCARLTDESAAFTSDCVAGGGASQADTAKLYRWDRNAPPGNRLTDLSADREPGDGLQPHLGQEGGLLGASADGDTAYFVTGGQIVSGEPTVAASSLGSGQGYDDLKVYRWQWNGGSPVVDYLGPYRKEGDATFSGRNRQVTPDGTRLVVPTRRAMDPVADADDDVDVYRWSEAEGWRCLSCQLPGIPSAGDSDAGGMDLQQNAKTAGATAELHSKELVLTFSDDGERIFFESADALVPQDTNGEAGCPTVSVSKGMAKLACTDVYEWHDGTVELISSGMSTVPSLLVGTTPSGRDVFFTTRERLVGWDTDDGVDIYTARIGGGFPEPASQPPECEGEGCREEGTDAPEIVGAGTAAFQGAGNPTTGEPARRCPANRLRRGKRCLTVGAVARKRCRRLSGQAKRRCVRKQARRLRRAQRRAKRRAQRRLSAHRANFDRRVGR